VPAAALSLIEAVDRYPSVGQEEDRLTELFASVLCGDPDPWRGSPLSRSRRRVS
jgi:hypothetical protein